MPTKQELFDKAVGGLIKQGECSYLIIGPNLKSCRYRLKKNNTLLKCVMGQLIPDDMYVSTIEGTSVQWWPDELRESVFGKDLSTVDIRFWSLLQQIHDQYARDFPVCIEKMKEYCIKSDLQWNF